MQDRDDIQAALDQLSEGERDRYQFCARRNGCDSPVELGQSIVEAVVDQLFDSVGLQETPMKPFDVRGGLL